MTCDCRQGSQVGGCAVVVRRGDVWNCLAAASPDAAAELYVIASITSSTTRHWCCCRLLPCFSRYFQLLTYYSIYRPRARAGSVKFWSECSVIAIGYSWLLLQQCPYASNGLSVMEVTNTRDCDATGHTARQARFRLTE